LELSPSGVSHLLEAVRHLAAPDCQGVGLISDPGCGVLAALLALLQVRPGWGCVASFFISTAPRDFFTLMAHFNRWVAAIGACRDWRRARLPFEPIVQAITPAPCSRPPNRTRQEHHLAALAAWPAAAGGGPRGVLRVVAAVTDLLQLPLANPTGGSRSFFQSLL